MDLHFHSAGMNEGELTVVILSEEIRAIFTLTATVGDSGRSSRK